jgi:YbgC/YbaW family acyl-CoA thioester hydrolase
MKSPETGTDSVREIEIQWGDLDSLGIVFYPHFFAWADAGAHQLFRAAGLPMDRLLTERKMSFGLVASGADFHSPARYGERLLCRSVVAKLGKRSVELVHRIVRSTDEAPVATVRETRVCMSVSEPDRIHARELPQDVSTALRRFVAPGSAASN